MGSATAGRFDGLMLAPTVGSIVLLLLLNGLASRTAMLRRRQRARQGHPRFYMTSSSIFDDDDDAVDITGEGGRVVMTARSRRILHRFFIFGMLVGSLAMLAWSVILASVHAPTRTLGTGSIMSNGLILLRYDSWMITAGVAT